MMRLGVVDAPRTESKWKVLIGGRISSYGSPVGMDLLYNVVGATVPAVRTEITGSAFAETRGPRRTHAGSLIIAVRRAGGGGSLR